MEYQNIICSQKEIFGVITINRPETGNKLSIECMTEMITALNKLRDDDSCDVVILTGQGDVFCSGGELGDYRSQNAQDILRFGEILVNLHQVIAEYPKLVLAAINGDVCGGGFSLIECCDLAVADIHAEFSIPEINDGLAPMISLMSIRNQLSRKQCMEMVVFGKKLDAQTTLSLGLINQVISVDNIVQAAMDYVGGFKDKNKHAFSVCKSYYQTTQGMTFAQQFEIGKHYLVSMLKSL